MNEWKVGRMLSVIAVGILLPILVHSQKVVSEHPLEIDFNQPGSENIAATSTGPNLQFTVTKPNCVSEDDTHTLATFKYGECDMTFWFLRFTAGRSVVEQFYFIKDISMLTANKNAVNVTVNEKGGVSLGGVTDKFESGCVPTFNSNNEKALSFPKLANLPKCSLLVKFTESVTLVKAAVVASTPATSDEEGGSMLIPILGGVGGVVALLIVVGAVIGFVVMKKKRAAEVDMEAKDSEPIDSVVSNVSNVVSNKADSRKQSQKKKPKKNRNYELPSQLKNKSKKGADSKKGSLEDRTKTEEEDV